MLSDLKCCLDGNCSYSLLICFGGVLFAMDFEGDLYGCEIRLEFYRFLRPETKFDSLTALQQQIHEDAAATRQYFENQ